MHAYVRVGSCWFLWDSCFRAFLDIFRTVWFLWNACMPTHSEATEEEEPQEDEEVAETSPAPVKKDKRGSQKSQARLALLFNQYKSVETCSQVLHHFVLQHSSHDTSASRTSFHCNAMCNPVSLESICLYIWLYLSRCHVFASLRPLREKLCS